MLINKENCKDLSDNEIVSKSLENLDYFSCLYLRFEPELERYIRRISGFSDEEVQDILQESFVRIWRNLNEFDQRMKLSSWIYRIVHNQTVSCIRKKKSFGKDRKTAIEDYNGILPDDANLETDQEDKIRLTHQILEKLPMKYREVLVLKFLEQKSYEDISDILKIPEGTVGIRINRAKKLFREFTGENNHN